MRLFIILLFWSFTVLGMGDPNFIPANPADSKVAPAIDNMMDTTSTLNQLENDKTVQEQNQDAERKPAQDKKVKESKEEK